MDPKKEKLNDTKDTPEKWYQKTFGIVAMLILFFPIGLFLMFKYSKWNNLTKTIISSVCAILILISLISIGQPKQTQQVSQTPQETNQEIKQEQQPVQSTPPQETKTENKQEQSSQGTSGPRNNGSSTTSKPQTQKSSNVTQQKDTSRTVYVAPTGEVYHNDPECGGKNATSTTLNKAVDAGRRPCKKCIR